MNPVIDTHVHLFAPDQGRFPYAPDAPYHPPAESVENYAEFAREAGLAHTIIVHPEPYQDDHRYLEYCFEREPRAEYFKGTCLFDPLRDDTPQRIRNLMRRWPKRIVAMRIHEMQLNPENALPIRNRDMTDTRMLACWKAIASLGLAVEMHFVPAQAPNIRKLASEVGEATVILDHMGRPGQGSEREYVEVLRLSDLPNTVMKFSGWEYYKGDLGELTRRIYGAFGPERLIWGMLGNDLDAFRAQSARFDQVLEFAPESMRARIRGANAKKLFFG